MTVTVQQVIQKTKTLPPDARVYVVGVSGTVYPIKEIMGDEVLTLCVEDEDADNED